MPDMNNLSMRDLAAYGEDEPRCDDCRQPAQWCACPSRCGACAAITSETDVHGQAYCGCEERE